VCGSQQLCEQRGGDGGGSSRRIVAAAVAEAANFHGEVAAASETPIEEVEQIKE